MLVMRWRCEETRVWVANAGRAKASNRVPRAVVSQPKWSSVFSRAIGTCPVSYTHLRAHETLMNL
eukprot:2017008-Prymnesium_polylepis.1